MLTVILATLKKGLFDAANAQTELEEFIGKIHLSMRGHCDTQGKFDWTSAVLDAAIISGITFFMILVARAFKKGETT
jgi:Na+/alanine symporter